MNRSTSGLNARTRGGTRGGRASSLSERLMQRYWKETNKQRMPVVTPVVRCSESKGSRAGSSRLLEKVRKCSAKDLDAKD